MTRVSIVLISMVWALTLAGPGAIPARASEPAGSVFLELVTAPRPAALGEAYVAVSDDVYGIPYNPAGSCLLNTAEIGAGYWKLFDKIHLNNFNFIYPFLDRFALGTDMVVLSFDDIKRDENGALAGDLSVNNFSWSINGSMLITEFWSIGANIKWVREDFDVVNGQTIGFDLGTMLRLPIAPEYGIVKAGLAVRNIGAEVDLGAAGDDLPLMAAAGISYKPIDAVLLTCEYQHEDAGAYNLGAEYVWADMVSFRIGSRFDSRQPDDSRLRAGLGFTYQPFGTIDYTYEDQENFGASHRIAYRYVFGETRNPLKPFKPLYNKSTSYYPYPTRR